MVVKKVMISLDGTLVSDMDNLVKAGFYKNRSALVHSALMEIQPLKELVEKRFYKLMHEMTPIIKTRTQIT